MTTWSWADIASPVMSLGVAISDLEAARDMPLTDAPAALAKMAEAERFIQAARQEIVTKMRDAGATWDQVGAALGISKQGARKVYGGH